MGNLNGRVSKLEERAGMNRDGVLQLEQDREDLALFRDENGREYREDYPPAGLLIYVMDNGDLPAAFIYLPANERDHE